ncbi:uncharacterized protein LOC130728835 [Lotus japonicus]|uniref:uncharacterized protein LOC130728835 n=1 Tax=Lotus japonicus TaxID=34305 RepID=UPI00258A7E5E|nr:uncharacterized protein LOC130728835 [Lotus japonicus]
MERSSSLARLLAEEFQNLINMRNFVLKRVEEASGKNEQINGAVRVWLDEVEKLLVEKMNLERKTGLMVNPEWCSDMIKKTKKLHDQCKFELFTIPSGISSENKSGRTAQNSIIADQHGKPKTTSPSVESGPTPGKESSFSSHVVKSRPISSRGAMLDSTRVESNITPRLESSNFSGKFVSSNSTKETSDPVLLKSRKDEIANPFPFPKSTLTPQAKSIIPIVQIPPRDEFSNISREFVSSNSTKEQSDPVLLKPRKDEIANPSPFPKSTLTPQAESIIPIIQTPPRDESSIFSGKFVSSNSTKETSDPVPLNPRKDEIANSFPFPKSALTPQAESIIQTPSHEESSNFSRKFVSSNSTKETLDPILLKPRKDEIAIPSSFPKYTLTPQAESINPNIQTPPRDESPNFSKKFVSSNSTKETSDPVLLKPRKEEIANPSPFPKSTLTPQVESIIQTPPHVESSAFSEKSVPLKEVPRNSSPRNIESNSTGGSKPIPSTSHSKSSYYGNPVSYISPRGGASNQELKEQKDDTSRDKIRISTPVLHSLPSGNFEYFHSTKQASEKILEALKDDSCCVIGLYGKKGSGKTALVKAEKAKYSEIFQRVLFPSVSKNQDILSIQERVANSLNLHFDEDVTQVTRAIRINSEFEKIEGSTLVILDDFPKKSKPEDLGIPCNSKQCKVLLTTRLKTDCNWLGCKPSILLDPLYKEEAWTLLQHLSDVDSQPNLFDVAREISFKCNGLPGLIKDVASSLENKTFEEWKETLDTLNHSTARYQIFVSFRGDDTRDAFTESLCEALSQMGFKTFMDQEALDGGEQISKVLEAIEESRFSIVVLSKNFADSEWCLKELVKILECKKRNHQLVLPIFYKVQPTDIKNLKESYRIAMAKHEEKFGIASEMVLKWKSALVEVSSLVGRTYEGSKAEFIQKIVGFAIEKRHRLHIQSMYMN